MIFSYLRKSVPFWDLLICTGRESQGGGRVNFLLPNDQAHVMDFHLSVLEQVLLPAFQGSWSLHRLHPARLPSSAIRVAPQMAMHSVQVNFYVIVRLMSTEWLQLADWLLAAHGARCWMLSAWPRKTHDHTASFQWLLVLGCHLWVRGK